MTLVSFLVQFAQAIALAGGRSDRGLTERDKHRGERCRRCVRPLPLEDRKLKIRQKRRGGFGAGEREAGGERGRRCVRPLPLEDRKLKIRQKRRVAFDAENAKSGDNRARRKRRDRETSQGCGADTRKTGARVDALPDQCSFAQRNERCVARNRMLAVQGQRQWRACNKLDRFRGCPYHWLPPYQAPPRCPLRTLS